MAGNTIASLLVKLGLDAGDFGKGIHSAEQSLMGFGKSAGIGVGIAAGAVAGGLLSTLGAARDWETAFAGVKKTLDTTGMTAEQEAAAFGKLEKELLDMSRSIPVSAAELAGLAEAAGALGVARDDISEFVRVTALIGVTTDVASEEAATALGKIGSVIGLTVDDYDNFGAALVDLGNKGASFESEILEMTNRLAGSAAVFGLSKDEVLGWGAAMANVGIKTEAGGSSFQRFAKAVLDASEVGTSGAKAIAEATGMTEQAFKDLFSRDTSAALQAVIEGVSKFDAEELTEFLRFVKLTGVRDFDFISKLAAGVGQDQKDLASTLDTASRAWEDNTAMMVEAERRFETLDSGMQLFWNTVNVLAITLGKTLIPPVRMLMEHLTNLVGGIGDLLQAFPALTAVITPVVTALAALVALKVGASIAGMLLPMKALSAVFSGLWGLIGRTGAVTAAASAAGAIGGAAYSAAAFVASKFMAAAAALWALVGGPKIVAAAGVAGAKAGAAYAGAAAGGGFLGSAARIAAGATVALAPAAIGNVLIKEIVPPDPKGVSSRILGQDKARIIGLDVTDGLVKGIQDGIGGVADFFGLRQDENRRAAQLRDSLSAIVVTGTHGVSSAAKATVAEAGKATDAMRAAIVTGTHGIAGSISKPVEEEFKAARRAIAQGFGSVKAALKAPDVQIIPSEVRLKNMQRRFEAAMGKLRQAVKAKDPAAIDYWTRAAITQKHRMDKMRNQTATGTSAIRKKFKGAGVSIDKTWLGVERSVGKHSRNARNKAKAQVQGIKTDIKAVNLADAGRSLMQTLIDGIRSMVSRAAEVASSVADTIAGFFKGHSPPRFGPLHTIDRDGARLVDTMLGGMGSRTGAVRRMGNDLAGAFQPRGGRMAMAGAGARAGGGPSIVINGNVYGGPAGLRELALKMEQSVRPTRRRRRG